MKVSFGFSGDVSNIEMMEIQIFSQLLEEKIKTDAAQAGGPTNFTLPAGLNHMTLSTGKGVDFAVS